MDNIPGNVGGEYSNISFNCSTIDKDGVLKIAKENDVDGICTFASDVAIPTVGYVADHLELNGISEKSARLISNKANFRKFQKENHLNSPHYIFSDNLDEFLKKSEKLNPPLIIKPSDASGSKGIFQVETNNKEVLSSYFQKSIDYSIEKIVCAEEFIQGVEVGGDGFLKNGKLEFVAITEKYLDEFIVRGHSYPTNISNSDQLRVISEIEKTCNLLGHLDGP